MSKNNAWMELEEQMVAESDHYPVKLPNFKRGDWELDDIEVTGLDILQNLRFIRDGMPECIVTPGKYKRLCRRHYRDRRRVSGAGARHPQRLGRVQRAVVAWRPTSWIVGSVASRTSAHT